MDRPLGRKIGNFLEVEETIDCLQGKGPVDEMDLTFRLAGWMLTLGGLCADPKAGESRARAKLADGSAWKVFLQNVAFQGGDVEAVLHPEEGPHAKITRPLRAHAGGYVARIDAYKVGIASVILGAGRSRQGDIVLPGVGITLLKEQGDIVVAGEDLCLVHGEDEARVAEALRVLEPAFETEHARSAPGPRVLEEITQA
jgi:pyrimidine-nucleoside phosphorylase